MLTDADAKELFQSGNQMPKDLPGHAQEFETAFETIAQQGEEFIKRIVDRVADYLQEMIAGKRVAKIPDYFP